jgi:hypothetical protein
MEPVPATIAIVASGSVAAIIYDIYKWRRSRRKLIRFATIETSDWKIELPDDWVDKSKDQTRLYFESGDGTKGFHIMTVLLKPTDHPARVVESFKEISERILARTPDWYWSTIGEKASAHGLTRELIVDHYDTYKDYRIIEKFIATPTVAINASFHDYNCPNIKRSDKYFQIIINSLRAKE